MRGPISSDGPGYVGYAGYSMPQVAFRQYANIGRNLLNSLIKNGDVDTVVVGERARHVIVQSWHDHLQRRLDGVERDPAERQRAIESYKRSLERSKGAKATKLARSGWGPDHGKRGGSPHRANRGAPRVHRSPPPDTSASKTKPSNRRARKTESSVTA
jgi:hypothetical protein